MKHLTQTRSDNCWQTCVAMILGREAEELPPQHLYGLDREVYARVLRAYLYKHHGLTYIEIERADAAETTSEWPYHLIIGESPRTSPDNDTWHAVVGLAGKPYWDVNPSRGGLTKVLKFGLLIPFRAAPIEWRSDFLMQFETGQTQCECLLCQESSHSSTDVGDRQCASV